MAPDVDSGDCTSRCRFTLLGPLAAWRDDIELDLGARQPRLILGLLLARAGGVVSLTDLVDALWAGEPPAQATNIIYRHIGAIRRLIEPGRESRSPNGRLQRRQAGYRLLVDEGELDLLVFRARLGHARAEQGEHALPHYAAALRLWHGPAAAGLDAAAVRHTAFVALDRERSAAAREAADVALKAGAAHVILDDLRIAAALDPFDEPLQARLISLMAADGKQADAVAAYHELRERLVRELGIDPGPELRGAYQGLLKPEPVAVPARAASEAPPEQSADGEIPAQLPATTRYFTGRREEMRTLSRMLPLSPSPTDGVTVVAIDGLPGVGKSTLAVQWAHKVKKHFPDGHLFINLRGFDARGGVVAAEDALTRFLNVLGVAHRRVPVGAEAQTALFRTLMSQRRMLVVLDNALDAEQIRPMIPASPHCMVVVTSRNRLTSLAAQDGAHLLTLDLPSPDEAREDLGRRLGSDRADTDPSAVDDIVSMCGRLPLALALVAARATALPEHPLREIADDIRRDAGSLDAFGGDTPDSDLRAVFNASYRQLSVDAARLFRLLPHHAGPDIGLAMATAVAGVPSRRAAELVGELTRTRLLTEHRPRRYVFHDLVRVYAMELAEETDSESERLAAQRRLAGYLVGTASAANRVLRSVIPSPMMPGDLAEKIPDTAAALAWFGAELPALEATAAVGGDTVRPWEITLTLLPFYERTGRYHAWRSMSARAMRAAAQSGDRVGEAHMLRMLAGAETFLDNYDYAAYLLERARAQFASLGMLSEEGVAHYNLGWVRHQQSQAEESHRNYAAALEIFERAAGPRDQALARLGLGHSLKILGRLPEAEAELDRAAEVFARTGDHNALANTADAKASVLYAMGRYDESASSRRVALGLFAQVSNQANEQQGYSLLGDTLRAAGRLDEARVAYESALALAGRMGLPDFAAKARERLDDLAAMSDEPR
jgi:DNA-binding SARP family transcriptional activator/tetratricopeptide (TPR) repeat protein